MLFLALIAANSLLLATTSATPVPVQNPPFVCGSIDLANGATQTLYEGACYEVEGIVNDIHVQDTCSCEFFAFKTCNAIGVSKSVGEGAVESVQGYYCQKI